MPASQRAKQFMPFAAVKGLEEAIAREEQDMKRGERPEFGEEHVGAVNAMLCGLRKGMKIYIQVYSCGQCQKGTIMKWLVDIVFFTICLVALAVIAVLTFRVKRNEKIEKKTIQTYLKIEIVLIYLLILSALTYVSFKIVMVLQ